MYNFSGINITRQTRLSLHPYPKGIETKARLSVGFYSDPIFSYMNNVIKATATLRCHRIGPDAVLQEYESPYGCLKSKWHTENDEARRAAQKDMIADRV